MCLRQYFNTDGLIPKERVTAIDNPEFRLLELSRTIYRNVFAQTGPAQRIRINLHFLNLYQEKYKISFKHCSERINEGQFIILHFHLPLEW